MKQFDVCENLVSRSKRRAPYVVVLQSDFLSATPTRLVAPLVERAEIEPIGRLNPEFQIAGRRLILSMLEMASLRSGLLGDVVGNLDQERHRIVGALDFVISGF